MLCIFYSITRVTEKNIIQKALQEIGVDEVSAAKLGFNKKTANKTNKNLMPPPFFESVYCLLINV
jgi:hypothetical protein